MTTAREKLYEEIVAMAAQPASASADAEIKKLMARYRVQTKPGFDIPPGATARDALGDRLLALWRNGAPDLSAAIGTTIDEFRMQMKGPVPGVGAKPVRAKSDVPALADDDDGAAPALPLARPRPTARPLEAAARPAAPRPTAVGLSDPPIARRAPGRGPAEPVAGGPRKRGKTRTECPKCHSMGVVLAHSYSGDEYFSCIYCGWQAYKPADTDDPNASLAVRLLGQNAGEPPRE